MIKPAELVEGEVYWCIRPTIESTQYDDMQPRLPWLGKLRIEDRGGPFYLLSVFNRRTGEIDNDSNATAIIPHPESDLFRTEADAKVSYLLESINYNQSLAYQLQDNLARLAGVMAEIGDCQ